MSRKSFNRFPCLESLDELEEMVVPKFSQIVNKNISRQLWQNEPYSKEQYGTKVYIVPVKDIRALTLSFTIDDLSKHYKSNVGFFFENCKLCNFMKTSFRSRDITLVI